jgi:hypothetical protein
MESDNKKNRGLKTLAGFLKTKRFLIPFIGIAVGAAGGFLYYHYVGCKSGTCPITSHPIGSVVMGGVFGYLITGMADSN